MFFIEFMNHVHDGKLSLPPEGRLVAGIHNLTGS
jgi:hypothetical protein